MTDRSSTGQPLSDRDRELLARWREPAPHGAQFGINRYLYEILLRNPRLRERFEDLDRAGDAYVEWLYAYGREELSLIDELMPPAPSEYRHFNPRTRPAGQVLPRHVGVNVTGFLQAELGIGEAGRLIVAALDARRIPVLPIEAMTRPDCRHGHHFDTLPPQAAEFPITITCANPDWLTTLVREAGREFFTERYSIGYWWWEVDGPTPFDWRRSFELVNEVWTASEHIAGTLRQAIDVPVIPVRLPVEVPPPPPLSRAQLGLPDGFMFLFMFDYASTLARKNPMAVIEAFKQAFGPHEGATLVIKCINDFRDAAGHDRLVAMAAEHPDIHVLDDYVSWAEKNAMIAACDCYVSLHRAEGFGLPLAEAMYLGKPTIATGYSGNLEFMTAENSHLVGYTMTEVGEAGQQYPPNGVWADPDVGHAAELMRRVFDDQPASHALGERAATDIRRTNSMEAAGVSMELRLANIVEARGLGLGPSTPPTGEPRKLASAAERLARGPAPPRTSAAGRLGPPLRRLVLRAMRPFTAYQRELDELIVAGLAESADEYDRRIRELEMRHAAARAAELAVGRVPRGAGEESLTHRVAALEQQLVRGALPLDLERFEAGQSGWVLGYRDAEALSAPEDQMYLGLEGVFRGPESVIRARQRRYLPLLEQDGAVVDLGCGRGELLELLQARGVHASGVDVDPAMVDLCLNKGLDVRLGDAVGHLDGLADESLGVIFAAQLIEHLNYDQLVRLLRLAAVKLRPGGRLVLESVNPHAPLGLKHFWLDPTHHHPLFPEVVLALCRMSGFATGYIWFPEGSGDAAIDTPEQLDYSVVAEVAPRRLEPPAEGAVNVQTDVGELWYPGDCQVLTPSVRQTGTWDPDDGAAMSAALAPGMTVVDVGAHVGYFALLAARCVGPEGKVLAVEPAPGNFALLRANVERAGADHVRTVNAAAWRDEGRVELLLSAENTGDNRVVGVAPKAGALGAATTVSVPAVKLDDLLAGERVDFVLLDTQGSERAVVEGMLETIARDRPRLQVEFWPEGIRAMGDDPAELLSFYSGLGYELSLIGTEEQINGNGTSLVDVAQARPGGFCTLVLTPRIG